MYTNDKLEIIEEDVQVTVGDITYPSNFPKHEIKGLYKVKITERPEEFNIIVKDYHIEKKGKEYIMVWKTEEKPIEEQQLFKPINLSGSQYPVTISDKGISIGCKFHKAEEWFNFTDDEINEMDKNQNVSEWWKIYKPIIQGIVNSIPDYPKGS